MGTKYLARTVIEGGRTGQSQSERDYSHKQERAAEQRFLARLAAGYDADDLGVEPRPRVYKSFSDKLGPAERWLRSHVGDPWDAVRSAAFRCFDSRTLPGRHILFCHLLPRRRGWRDQPPEENFGPSRATFFVDEHGILRERPRRRRRPEEERQTYSDRTIERWLGNWRVGQRGRYYFWFQLVGERCLGHDRRGREILGPVYRQSTQLKEASVKHWLLLTDAQKERFSVPLEERDGTLQRRRQS
jgi:hypothetical protein